ncbi:unnamed protein product [Amoebophrya sp. A120]|nr:unnamed protein product [Amoebophrya sp. A120]|eukprot:GSA120T00023559001.1
MEGPTSKASSSSAKPQPKSRQRGIFSEVLRQHNEEDVEGCRMGPGWREGPIRTHGSAAASSFRMSDESRSRSNAYLEQLQAAGRTKIKALNGEGRQERSSADKLISTDTVIDGKALDLAYPDSQIVEIGSIEPKVIEVYAHAPGTKPRKVTVERQKRYFASLNPEELFRDRGISMADFVQESNRSLRNRKVKLDRKKGIKESQLDSNDFDLLDFDDTEYDVRKPREWMTLIPKPPKGSKKRTGLKAKGLRVGGEADGSFEACVIYQYEGDDTNYFYGLWYDDETPCFLSRLDFFFDGEDPVAYADRVANAFRQRQLVASHIKFLFYVDNVPTDGISTLNVDQVARLKKNARSSAELCSNGMDHFVESLVNEVKLDYGRVLNRLCLLVTGEAKGLSPLAEMEEQAITGAPDVDSSYASVNAFRKPAKFYALHPVPAYNFTNLFAQFCFSSLYVKPQVVTTLVQIREACLALEKSYGTKIFQTKFPRNARIDQFRTLQTQSINAMLSRCKEWVLDLKKVVVTNFEDVQKGWYSIKETNAETYKYGKIKKLLTMIRFIMETSIFEVVRASIQAYEQKIVNYTPTKCTIKSLKEVEVAFRTPTPEMILNGLSRDDVAGIFLMELKVNENKEQNTFQAAYSANGADFLTMVTEVIDSALVTMADISQPEPLVMSQFVRKTDPPKNIETTHPSDEKVVAVKKRLEKMMQPYGAARLEDYRKLITPYLEPLQQDVAEIVASKQDEENPASVQDIAKHIHEEQEKEHAIMESLPESITAGLYEISLSEARNLFAKKHNSIAGELLKLLDKRYREMAETLMAQYTKIKLSLKKAPKDVEELAEIKEYMETVPGELLKLEVEAKKVFDVYDILVEDFRLKVPQDATDLKWSCFKGTKDIMDTIAEVKQEHADTMKSFFREIQDEQFHFDNTLHELEEDIANFVNFTDLSDSQSINDSAESISERLKSNQETSKLFNLKESLFGVEPHDYGNLTVMQRDWEPFSILWKQASDWQNKKKAYFSGKFDAIEAKDCEDRTNTGIKLLFKATKAFTARGEDYKGVLAITEQIKEELADFQQYVPLIVAMRNEGMKERHWTQISELVGVTIDPEMENFSLQNFIDLGLMNTVTEISDIGDRSGKEFQIEKQLAKMKADWEPIEFDCKEFYRTTETYILKGSEEVNAILDEQNVLTQAIQFSPFNKPFIEEIEEWAVKLLYVSECIDMWLKVQRAWMYLQPIFDSPDIMKQLPTEGKKFKAVDHLWRHWMGRVHKNPGALNILSTEGLLEKWRNANNDLEFVQKGLDDYLQTKRDAFARFYFLSNDELLEILSQTKDPTRVQPFLCKVFENIKRVTFGEEMQVLEIFSSEGEKIVCAQEVKTKDRNVEEWMGNLEKEMCNSVRAVMQTSIETYVDTERTKWVLEHPGQCVLNGSQVHWTDEVEEAIEGDMVTGYWEKLGEQLMGLVMLVRGKITKLQRTCIGALVVIDVHAKDVVQRLTEEKVDSKDAFEWISQLRYYWEEDDTGIENVWVRMVQTNFPYGYEYLGNTFRLVITALTDMCYMTLMGAQSLNLGGAPAGPAGTGKTESTKDLAKALAKQCVVFNCSPEMDYIMVGKFFKGLAVCGAWCCFDEFNRIYIEVLSVIAQQLLILFGGKSQLNSYSEVLELDFEGSFIAMRPTFNVFITMNPGYAGRTELPDNLSALFRPCAMMVPDYALIGEIMFYAFGFTGGRAMAKKMVSTFKLASEQLSSQDHYDYGMRAVKTVIEAAGRSKRIFPDMEEFQILLRALRDVNVPKFLRDDLPLFENIILDLFPGTDRPEVDYGQLAEKLNECAVESKLQPTPYFCQKMFELFDMIQVRHGMMLVGPTGGGKTCNYRVLQKACTVLCPPERNDESPYQKTQTHILNPKSITQAQIYGAFDELTHEWTDGIGSEQIRVAVRDAESPDHHWIIFDGPVDALWIESMNTVLDDNKKLCLVSGEIIGLTPQMRMMFEVEDLEVASPATVSRCGMIYMEPESLTLDPLIQSYVESIPETFLKFKPVYQERLKTYMTDIFDTTIFYIKKSLGEVCSTTAQNLACSCMRLLNTFYAAYWPTELKLIDAFKKEVEDLEPIFGDLFLFCLVWSVGGSLAGANNREQLNDYLWTTIGKDEKWAAKHAAHNDPTWEYPTRHMDFKLDGIPEEGANLYDYMFDITTGKWVPWMDTIPAFEVPRTAKYENIVVPSLDSIRMTYAFKILLENDSHVLCCGPTGTGKTVNLSLYLQKYAPGNFLTTNLAFSAQTQVNQVQDFIDSKLEKRRRGVYGPPAGKKMVLFTDDLNMPQKEFYGAQPPIELLRQWFDHEGWYNRKELAYFQIIDMLVAGSMGTPGGGRTFITERLKRHFNVLGYSDFTGAAITTMFTTIANKFFDPFPEDVKALVPKLVEAQKEVFNKVLLDLLPTPARAHYLFNLRDIWKVFMGVCALLPKKVEGPIVLLRCWCHEVSRVFGDRLIDAGDRTWLQNLLEEKIKTNFAPFDVAEVFHNERLIFAEFMEPLDSRSYEEIQDLTKMVEVLEDYLDDYNNQFPTPMPLVIFLDFAEHVARINRTLNQPQGNMLLLGVGGSGRQSSARLAAFANDNGCYQIEVAKGYGMVEFRDDIKTVLKRSGVEGKTQVFLFTDTQIVNEQFVEVINSVLNSGDVPNLYNQEDMDQIGVACRPACQQLGLQPTKTNIFAAYLSRVKANVHVVLAFSPIGDAFRNRLRMFPSLVNCCTIDWFREWPAEALYAVAKQQMTLTDLKLPNLEGTVNMFKIIHQSVEKVQADFLDREKRFVYVTPTSYLELLSSFKKILEMKRNEVGGYKHRYQVGLDKISSAELQVNGLQEDLKAMQPVLEKTSKEVEEMMVVIARDKEAATVVQETCAVEEKAALEISEQCTAIKEDAQRDLDEALPALEQAVQCLKRLKMDHLREVKALANPPSGVKLTMESICIMFQVPPVKKNDPERPGKKIDDYWEASKLNVLNDPKKLLDNLFGFDRDNIPESVISKINPYMEREDFDPAAIKRASVACEAMCMWTRAMYKYHHVAKAVEPKRQKLRGAEEELAVGQAKLAKAQAELAEVNQKIAKLESEFSGAVAKKDQLERDSDTCAKKLVRANKLIGGLGGEKARWGENVEQLTASYELLPGDSMVAAGAISYSGPFTARYRAELENTWRSCLEENEMKFSPGTSMAQVLGEPVKIQGWIVCQLPNDDLSIENAIIIDKSRRWPLMIDPQRQANKYIKNMGKQIETGIDIVKLSDSSFLRTLELGIQFGKWILLENIGITLDPALEPVLLQNKVKEGSSYIIRLGDKSVNYGDTFRFFMTTTLPNPHYSPETSVKVTLLNFAITPVGLEDQMLGILVGKERADLQEAKEMLVTQNAKMNKQLKEIEDEILHLLATSEGDVLEDDKLINVIYASKATATEINQKKKEAAVTEKEIDEARESYRTVAYRASVLFFGIVELSNVDPMYQFSLQWFQNLFAIGIDQSTKSDVLDERLDILKDYFTESLYQNVCRGLFEKDKLMFSFALCLRLLAGDNNLNDSEVSFLLTGPTSDLATGGPPVPADWVSKSMWNEILTVSKLPAFDGFSEYFSANVTEFRRIYDAIEAEKEPIPGPWEEKLDMLEHLCFLRAMRLSRLTLAIVQFIAAQIGKKFVEPPTFDIQKSFGDSMNITPLIFILVSGSDPVGDVIGFAEKMGMSKKLDMISLGQGQGPKAAALIENGVHTGSWVLLQNCHLAISWMPKLESIVEQFNPDNINSNFRLWLTSMPSIAFPVQVLQIGVKMTNEPPKGLRANLLRSYSGFSDEYITESNKPETFKKLLFSFCFFHAVIQDRRKFGPIGWNIPYGFTTEDLTTCKRQLMSFINQYEEVPIKVLLFLGASINYGGRVTDAQDKRLVTCILGKYVNMETINDPEYKFSDSGLYYAPLYDTMEEYMEYIRNLPLSPSPEAFGMDENCAISTAEGEALALLAGIVAVYAKSGSGGGGRSKEDVMEDTAKAVLDRIPPEYDIDFLEKKYPTMYEESMNTVLKQEAIRYNKLLGTMHKAIPTFRKALKGLVVMSSELEQMGNEMFLNQVPSMWADKGFLSLKPLSAWQLDLTARLDFLTDWLQNAKPPIFWVSGFFFPQAFLTGALQNHARKYNFEIDRLEFLYLLQDGDLVSTDFKTPPEDGIYVWGLFLEGARFCNKAKYLRPSEPKVLYTPMPVMHFSPQLDRKTPENCYRCPVYKVLSRRGVLMTTGHSTNFVLYLEVPSDEPGELKEKWIRAGVAAFLALRT